MRPPSIASEKRCLSSSDPGGRSPGDLGGTQVSVEGFCSVLETEEGGGGARLRFSGTGKDVCADTVGSVELFVTGVTNDVVEGGDMTEEEDPETRDGVEDIDEPKEGAGDGDMNGEGAKPKVEAEAGEDGVISSGGESKPEAVNSANEDMGGGMAILKDVADEVGVTIPGDNRGVWCAVFATGSR